MIPSDWFDEVGCMVLLGLCLFLLGTGAILCWLGETFGSVL